MMEDYDGIKADESRKAHRRALFDAVEKVALALVEAEATYPEVYQVFSRAKHRLGVALLDPPRGSQLLEESLPL